MKGRFKCKQDGGRNPAQTFCIIKVEKKFSKTDVSKIIFIHWTLFSKTKKNYLCFLIVSFRDTADRVGHLPVLVPWRDSISGRLESWFPCQSKTWLIAQEVVLYENNNTKTKMFTLAYVFKPSHITVFFLSFVLSLISCQVHIKVYIDIFILPICTFHVFNP